MEMAVWCTTVINWQYIIPKMLVCCTENNGIGREMAIILAVYCTTVIIENWAALFSIRQPNRFKNFQELT
jgi:hypothetical protein